MSGHFPAIEAASRPLTYCYHPILVPNKRALFPELPRLAYSCSLPSFTRAQGAPSLFATQDIPNYRCHLSCDDLTGESIAVLRKTARPACCPRHFSGTRSNKCCGKHCEVHLSFSRNRSDLKNKTLNIQNNKLEQRLIYGLLADSMRRRSQDSSVLGISRISTPLISETRPKKLVNVL